MKRLIVTLHWNRTTKAWWSPRVSLVIPLPSVFPVSPWLVISALLALALLVSPTQAQVQDNRVGLVIRFSNEAVFKGCFPHTPGMTGLDLLTQAGLDLSYRIEGLGALVCRIGASGLGEDGCRYPEEDCLCQARRLPWRYWAYWSLENEGWRYSGFGAAARALQPGAVDGWAWGEGDQDTGTRPTNNNITFNDVCPVPTATATTAPTHTATLQPTSTATLAVSLTPLPTRTFEATITPIPTYTPIPTSTVEPTWTPSPIPTATDTPLSQTEPSATPQGATPAATWTPISLPNLATWTVAPPVSPASLATATPPLPQALPPTATALPLVVTPVPPVATPPPRPSPGVAVTATGALLPATPTAVSRGVLTPAVTAELRVTVTPLPTLPQSVSLNATSIPGARVDLSRLTPVADTSRPTNSQTGTALNYGIFAALVVGLIAFLVARQRGLL